MESSCPATRTCVSVCDAGDDDDDNDGVDDLFDDDPLDPFVCRDTDDDSCDDCSSGTVDRTNDGTDTDSDGACNDGDLDDDNDGVNDTDDPAPLDPDVCGDSDRDTCDDCVIGTDDFGPFGDQLPGNDGDDHEGDGLCDAGDPDDDNDGVDDDNDSDPLDPFICGDVDSDSCEDCVSGTSAPENDGDDLDQDGLCNEGDPDDDNDTILDEHDNCPRTPNAGQEDEDEDTVGDVCDVCLADPFNDYDLDGFCSSLDNCPSVSNPTQSDTDGNGIGDQCELVPINRTLLMFATEVTNSQYAMFLNAVAESDPNGLYNQKMGSDPRGGIRRIDFGGFIVYSTKPDMPNKPVNFVSWLDATRFANWLHNGKPTGAQAPGTTETGAYDLTIRDPGENAVRHHGANWFLPNRIEWDTAAYSDPSITGQWLYPTRSNTAPQPATAATNGDVDNQGLNIANYDNGAVWNQQTGNVTTVGGCGSLSASYWGTYDQGGNVAEWVENGDEDRVVRGGSYRSDATSLEQTTTETQRFDVERAGIGFRVARGV